MLRVVCSILVLAVAATGYGQAQMSPEAMLEGGIRAEVVDGNLTEAIAIYESVASRPDVDRAVAAKALLHLAGCYEKLGDDAALAVYQRIRDDYGDVAEVAASARERLAAMGETGLPPQDRVQLQEPQFVKELGGWAYRPLRSPDRRFGVYTDYGAPRDEPGAQGGGVGGYNVVVIDYETEQITRLTNFTTIEEGISDVGLWAPDSRRLAYAVKGSGRDHEVRVFTVGGATRTVFRRAPVGDAYFAAEPTSWSPDGRKLALLMDNGDESATVGLLDVASGDVTQLATFAWPSRLGGNPKFSPDGRYLSVVHTVDGSDEIFTLSIDGSRMTQLTDDPGSDAYPLWSRDGSHILFVSDRLGQNGLWAMPLQDGRPTSEPMLLDGSWPGTHGTHWIGDRLAYSDGFALRNVYTLPIDPDSGKATGPAQKVGYKSSGLQFGIAWSPDGALTFISRTDLDEVVVLYPDGTTKAFRIPEELQTGIYGSLQFGTGGRVIWFANRRFRLVSVDTDSGEFSDVGLPEDRAQTAQGVVRGPEPTELYYLSSRAAKATAWSAPRLIRRFDSRSEEATDLFELDHEALLHRMFSSPDGSRLRIADGRTFYEIDLASGDIDELFTVDRSLPAGSCTGFWGDVSPDRRKMVIAGVEELLVVDLESGASHGLGVRLDQLFAGLPDGTDSGCFPHVRWSPAGDQIAFTTQTGGSQLWTIPDPLEAVLSGAVSR
jgi:Tol biopolymer transport system component